ncbi:MAG: hypothetical protein K8M05_11425 [Deltaproteobacteria bacterium]|nr:hypothetical protein [Kofleriaceae bacterium]
MIPGLGALIRGGVRAVSQYTGMLLALFVVHVLVAWGAGVIIAQILAEAFAHRPLFDDAVDGDLIALVEVLASADAVIFSVRWVAIGAVIAWAMIGWFLAGGVLAVFTERPRGRTETARCFGAGGANHFLVFARLALVTTLYHLPVFFLFFLGLDHIAAKLEHALTTRELVVPLLVGLLPAAIAHVIVSTVIDYARAEIALRRPTHESLGATRAALRATGYVFRRPVALLHVGVYWLFFFGVTLAFMWLAHGRAMLGFGGAMALLALRQGIALLRLGARVAVIAGQVELTATRPPPPREVPVAEG